MTRRSILLFTLVLFAGCAAPAPERTPSAPAPAPLEWSGVLRPAANAPAVRGAASAQSHALHTTIAISMAGGAAGRTYAWQLHAGRCEAPGAAVVAADGFPPLQADERGRAVAEVSLGVGLEPGGAYAVSVADAGAPASAIACAQLNGGAPRADQPGSSPNG